MGLRLVLMGIFHTLSIRRWWGDSNTYEQVPRVDRKHRLSPKQAQACKHKSPTFRYRGKPR